MKLPITITYNSGDSATYVAQPPEWAKWERETKKIVTDADGKIGMWDLMFLAYHAYKRENAGKPVKSYEIWSETVANVTVGDDNPKATNQEA
jgi:hypothetical protein